MVPNDPESEDISVATVASSSDFLKEGFFQLEERPDSVPTDKGFRQKGLPLLLHLKLVEDIQGIGASHWGS